MERYTCKECPRTHLRIYSQLMRGMGLDEAQLIMLFPLSLSSVAQSWFATLDASCKWTLEDLAHVVGESDSMGPPLSFDILSGFVSHSNDVLAFSSMDLSIFEYLHVPFIDDIDACAPHSLTSQIHDIDDKPL